MHAIGANTGGPDQFMMAAAVMLSVLKEMGIISYKLSSVNFTCMASLT